MTKTERMVLLMLVNKYAVGAMKSLCGTKTAGYFLKDNKERKAALNLEKENLLYIIVMPNHTAAEYAVLPRDFEAWENCGWERKNKHVEA